MRVGIVAAGGFDRSRRERVIPALLWLVERLARRHEVHVFVLRYSPEACTYALCGATVHDLGRPRGVRRQRRALLDAVGRIGGVDLLHAYWATPSGVTAGLAGRALDVPVLLTLDSGELVSLPDIRYGLQRTWRGRMSVRLACRLATRITVCTAHMRELAHLHDLEAAVVPFGVDSSRFAGAPRPPDGPPWRLLQVASLNPVKDQATLLEALARLRRGGQDVTLDLVGEDTLAGVLQARATALGLDGRVRFHGFRPTDELREVYGAAHLYVQSSRHEAAGVSVLEAATSGVPVVGTATGYVRDWDGRRAVAVPPGQADALAEAIALTLASPGRRRELAARARTWTLAHDAAATTGDIARIYAQLTSSSTERTTE